MLNILNYIKSDCYISLNCMPQNRYFIAFTYIPLGHNTSFL